MNDSLSERCILAIISALTQIHSTNGYYTNAGSNVLRAQGYADIPSLPAIVVWETSKAPYSLDTNFRYVNVELNISVEGHVTASQNTTGVNLSKIEADIWKAVLKSAPAGILKDSDGELGKISWERSDLLNRPDGASSEAVSLKFSIRYKQKYADPTLNK